MAGTDTAGQAGDRDMSAEYRALDAIARVVAGEACKLPAGSPILEPLRAMEREIRELVPEQPAIRLAANAA